MNAANLGTKRQCPKCAAKFYDFGAAGPVVCPKCGASWKEGSPAKAKKAAKPKKEKAPLVMKKPKTFTPLPIEAEMPDGLPEVEEGGEIEELEPMEEEEVEMTSLEEVEEHEEEKADPDSDDAEDDMFTEIAGEEKLVDDLDQYIETDKDHEDEEEKDDKEDEEE